jgi:hypothetical protein
MGVALRTGEPQRDNEVVIERPDGSRIIVLVNVELLRSPGGELEGAIASFQDITGRKRIEEALASRVDEQAALYQFSNQLQRATSFADIHEAALDAIIRALRCQRASILLGDEAGKMRFVAWRGLSADYRRAVAGHSPWPHNADDPQPIAVEDVESAGLDAAVKAIAKAEGIAALAFIPLVTDAKLVGKFMAYYPLAILSPTRNSVSVLPSPANLGAVLSACVPKRRAAAPRKSSAMSRRFCKRSSIEFPSWSPATNPTRKSCVLIPHSRARWGGPHRRSPASRSWRHATRTRNIASA